MNSIEILILQLVFKLLESIVVVLYTM